MTPMERIERELQEARQRIAELEREVELHRAAEHLQISLRERAEEERDAMAAHVERLKEAFKKGYADMNWTWVKEVLDEASPATSLARRDLIKQAEALEEQVEKMRDNADSARDNGYTLQAAGMEDAADFLAADAAGLRRQAEVLNE